MFIVASAISVVHCMADVENTYGVLFSHIDFHWLARVKINMAFSFRILFIIGCVCFTLTPGAAVLSLGGSCARRTPIVPCVGMAAGGVKLFTTSFISSRLMNLCCRHNVTESCCGVAQIHSGDYSVRHFGSSRAAWD